MKKTAYFLFFLLLCFNFSFSQNFDEKKTKALYEKFNEQLRTPFKYKTLKTFLKDVLIEDLKSGKVVEKEVLFEDFNCDCTDKLKISYDKKTNVFILFISEKTFDKNLDWCPEHTFLGFFNIEKNEIVAVEFKFIAG